MTAELSPSGASMPPTGAGEVSTEFVKALAKYGASPRLLRALKDVTRGPEPAPSQPADEATPSSDLPGFTHEQQGEVADRIRELLPMLSGREADVIRLRFGLGDNVPRTLDDIGQIYGVTRERVRQIESRAIAKIRREAPAPAGPESME